MNRITHLILALLLLIPSVSQATVVASTSRIKATCNGSTTEFPFTFNVADTDEVLVIKTDSDGAETTLAETTDYTVSCTNNDCTSGGTVTVVDTCASGSFITILRGMDVTQETDYTDGMPALYETFEADLDKQTRIAQEQAEQLNRALIIPKSDTVSDVEVERVAGGYLRWDSSGADVESASVVNDSGSFLQSGTGAVSRTVSSKLAEVVSVTDFGAVGDGVTDDTEAIQAAIDSVDAIDLETLIYFPRGKYMIAELDASDNAKKVSFKGESPRTVQLIYNGSGGANSYMIKFPSAGKSFGEIKNISFVGYDTNDASGGIVDNILNYQGPPDMMHRLHNCSFSSSFGDAVLYTGAIINTHVDHVRFDSIGGYCFNWSGSSGLESRIVTVSNFTMDNNISGAFATRATALGYYDGTRWGKGFSTVANVDGVSFQFQHARIELNKPLIIDSRSRVAIFYTDVPSGFTSIKLKNVSGYSNTIDAGLIVYAEQDNTNFIGEDLLFYNNAAIFENSSGIVIPNYSLDKCSYYENEQQSQGVVVQGKLIEYRDAVPDGTIFQRYTRGDIIFETDPTAGDRVGWVCLTPTSSYGVPNATTVDTLAAVTASSATVTVTASKMRFFHTNMSVKLTGAGVAGADLTTYVTDIDVANSTITVNDTPSTSVDPATINYVAPTFAEFGNVALVGSLVWNPASLGDGAGETSSGIAVTGAALGDFVIVAAPYDLQDCLATGYVQTTDTVEIRLQNESTGTRNLASGTWRVRVIKP